MPPVDFATEVLAAFTAVVLDLAVDVLVDLVEPEPATPAGAANTFREPGVGVVVHCQLPLIFAQACPSAAAA